MGSALVRPKRRSFNQVIEQAARTQRFEPEESAEWQRIDSGAIAPEVATDLATKPDAVIPAATLESRPATRGRPRSCRVLAKSGSHIRSAIT